MIVVDTHVLLWDLTSDLRLGPRARETMARATFEGELAVSAISFWEVGLLVRGRRINFLQDTGAWRRRLLEEGLTEIPVDGEIGVLSTELTEYHNDPADRIIMATAIHGDHRLLTGDGLILRWPGTLSRIDARR